MHPSESELGAALHVMSSPVELPTRLCEVRDSEIQGRGLFAAGDIPKGSVVTLYPADLVRVEVGRDQETGERLAYALRVSGDAQYPIARSDYESQGLGRLFGDYGFSFSCPGAGAVCVSPHAEHVSAPRGTRLGHMANDPSSHSDLRSVLDSNATVMALGGLVPCIVAVEDIAGGQEITVPYPQSHWNRRTPSELGRFLSAHVQHMPTRAKWIAWQSSNSVRQRILSAESLKAIAEAVAVREHV